MPRGSRLAALLALTVLGTGGCRLGGSGKSFVNENDTLRAENLELSRAIDAFQDRVQLLDAELSELRRDRQGDAPLPGAIPPVLSALKFARYTGPIDTNGDGADDRVCLLYTSPSPRDRTRSRMPSSA